jgi:RHS repeat-associated protein
MELQFVYDGDGNRVSKTVNGVTTKYLVDTNNLTGYAQVVEELQNGSVSKQYTYGLDLISQRQSSGVSFYNYDGHGSVRGLSNNLGNLTDTYSYDAFGALIEKTGNTDNNYLYAGEQFDSDLEFYYNRARYLNVETGRFISQDSYEGVSNDPKSLHKYVYVGNNPVDLIDPSGNSYVETLQVPVLSNIIDLAFIGQAVVAIGAGYVIARIFTKRWTLYASIKPQFPEYHNAIFAIDSLSGKKWAYDVGAERAVWVRDITRNPFNFYPAYILKHQREPESEYLFPIPIGKMSDSQLVAWEFSVMGSSNGADFPNEVPFFYSLAFSNCATWTLSASETAILLSLNPL